jgi:hypothetical protein
VPHAGCFAVSSASSFCTGDTVARAVVRARILLRLMGCSSPSATTQVSSWSSSMNKLLMFGPLRARPNITIIAGVGVDVDLLLCPPAIVRLNLLRLRPLDLPMDLLPLHPLPSLLPSLLFGEHADAGESLNSGNIGNMTIPYGGASRMSWRQPRRTVRAREEMCSIEVGVR